MTDLVDRLASMDAVHMSQYLKEVGWTGMDDHSVKIDATSSVQSIPGMSYMFLIKDPMLEAMAKAASSFTPNTASSTAQLKPAIQAYLQQTRDGFEYIPGYNALNTLAGLTNNPAIAQLTQLIGFLADFIYFTGASLAIFICNTSLVANISVIADCAIATVIANRAMATIIATSWSDPKSNSYSS
ncbi:hypothetical protein IW146_003397 [Coemansia sp. RSA 922]|nr:hypothetical protein IW146_003397 [Coemansia sp. RSA 922]